MMTAHWLAWCLVAQLLPAGPIELAARERAAVVPKPDEDWFNQQLLVPAKEARVAYALVWQTY